MPSLEDILQDSLRASNIPTFCLSNVTYNNLSQRNRLGISQSLPLRKFITLLLIITKTTLIANCRGLVK